MEKSWFSKNVVLSISLMITLIFVLFGIFNNEGLASVAGSVLAFTTDYLGWFYLTATLGFLVFSTYLLFSRFGKVRLGDSTDRPEYSTPSWIAMLFSAGMGIGLIFWSVAEPIFHYNTPPVGEGGTAEAAIVAMQYSYFHWGLHPWAIYTVIGLSLAFFQYKKKLPGLISSAFYPILGDKIKGTIGKTIDILAIFATIFGIATSLGLGTLQITGGLNFLYGVDNSISSQIIVIAFLTILFASSAFVGINKGMKVLSNINLLIALGLMVFLIIFGPTSHIFKIFTGSLGSYLNNLVPMSLNIRAFSDNSWISGWTLFYWAWWIAWAPFVGSFIAKISKGRTIKEFVLGVLFIPTLGTFVWFSAFGGSALHLVQNLGHTALVDAANSDVTTALFAFLQYFPLGAFVSTIALILIVTFFVTSADSATFVLAMFSAEGHLNPSPLLKVTWGIILALVAIVLLLAGSLDTLQTASIAAAFPFTLIMVMMCISLVKALSNDFPIIAEVTVINKKKAG